MNALFTTDAAQEILICQSLLPSDIPRSEIVFRRIESIEIVEHQTDHKQNDTIPNNINNNNNNNSGINGINILTYQQKINHCKTIAVDLYNKYIKIESDYEVNISWYARNELICQLDNKNKWMDPNQTNINDTHLYNLFEFALIKKLVGK